MRLKIEILSIITLVTLDLEAWAQKNKHYEVVGEGVTMKLGLNPEVREQCLKLGEAMAKRLLAD